ncbi:pseudouridine synthase [Microstroma glucosiphilum]|uniref:tRNA pseudouridine synthase 1 n=1 Tax=Pseudomicrostroma glucosiphilum TaxID=1684307 RepID=A0A316U7H6_9BASI|nr:pseudouridine synthase [Pseudomicrostroma glucosiphilum]PWN21190.1 pseudouridine synthase [Pseudomicrostroma glucosiphilum]
MAEQQPKVSPPPQAQPTPVGEEVAAASSSSAVPAGTKRAASPTGTDATAEPNVATASSSSSSAPKRPRRIDKRGDQDREASPPRATGADGENDDDAEKRLPKRRAAILFGYCGVGYSGLQVNPGVKTVEGDIFDVLCQAGCVSKENAVNPNKVGLQRAARTDRGVHAAGNLINLKLILNPPAVPSGDTKELIDHLNGMLPPLIRIWNIVRVQSAFNARASCDSRYYQYLLPTYAFLPPRPGCAMWKMFKGWEDKEEEAGGEEGKRRLKQALYHPFWVDALKEYEDAVAAAVTAVSEPAKEADASTETEAKVEPAVKSVEENGADSATNGAEAAAPAAEQPSQFKRDTVRKRQWRMESDEYGRETLSRVRSLWNYFLGTKNFHNYTVGKPFKDPSAKRTMKELEISDPFIVNNTEYVSLTLHGQSFMLHQIRKMVGLLVLVARSPAPETLMKETFSAKKIHVPKAPALGLLLNSPVFGGYNIKVRQHNASLGPRFAAGKLTAEEREEQKREEITYAPLKGEMEEFRMRHIYQTQYETEEREDEFAKWLNYIDAIVGNDFLYLNGKGVIPPESVVGSGASKSGQPKKEQEKSEIVGAEQGKEKKIAGAGGEAEYHESDDEDDVVAGKGADLEG